MSHQTTKTSAASVATPAWPSQANTNAPAFNAVTAYFQPLMTQDHPQNSWIQDWMREPQTRHAYMVACVEQDIAWQIRINRERRGWTQSQLAKLIGTRQSAVARMEDPTYGKYSIATLTKLANMFGCAVMLRMVDFKKFSEETQSTHEDALYVKPYEDLYEQ